MCDCRDNRPQMFEVREPIARKPHKCCECDRTIAKGEKYEACSGKWDSGFETFHTCLECAAERAELTKSDPDGCGPCFTQLQEYKSEMN